MTRAEYERRVRARQFFTTLYNAFLIFLALVSLVLGVRCVALSERNERAASLEGRFGLSKGDALIFASEGAQK